MRDHPHVDATYNLITLDDGTFAVEVVIPATEPTKVSGFDTQQKAEAWIERHKAKIASGNIYRTQWGYRSKPRKA